MKRNAQLVATRAVRRHPDKSGAVWQLPTTASESEPGPGKQKERTITLVTLDVVESYISERESDYYGLSQHTGLLKLHISGEHDLSTATKLICDGRDVDIVKLLGLDENATRRVNIVIVDRHDDAAQ